MMHNSVTDLNRDTAVTARADHVATSMSVIIVSYNSRELLRDCLASLHSEPWDQVIVVDNLSSDGSDEMLRRDFPWVNLIISSRNGGYGAAANLGIAAGSSKYALVLNPDTVLQRGALQTLSDYLDQHPQAAIVGPRLLNPDGTYQTSCFEFPTPLQTLLRETSLSRFIRHSPNLPFSDVIDGSVQSTCTVPWVLGAALGIRRVAFDTVGGFDESFFMYFEEVDLCYRLHQAGWQVHFAPEALVMHIGGASTKRHRAVMLQQLYGSLCHFYQQHYAGSQKAQLRLILTYLMLRNIVRDTFRSVRSSMNDQAADNVSVWRSILANVWSVRGWLKD